MQIFQKGFNYSQDGPGNRLVYHLTGCNMRCPWCSNPECMETGVENPSPEEIYSETLSCRALFFDGGGVTFTGGEPTLQFEELKTALILLKKAGISTAIESNATHPRLAELFPLLDALILDFKHWDDGAHFAATGQHNRAVKENLCAAFSLHPNLLVRTVLIKGFNDTQNDAEACAAVYRKNGGERAKFEFLPYHEYGKAKWKKCGREYAVTDAFVSEQTVQTYAEIYRQNHLNVVKT